MISDSVVLPEFAYADVSAAAAWLCDAFGFAVRLRIADHPYGERQYTVQDLGGHAWTFSQTLADVDPASWGGELAL